MKKYLLAFILLFSGVIAFAQCGVVINEIVHHPVPSIDTAVNSFYNSYADSVNSEWIELYNPSSCDSVDISCWILGSNETDSTSALPGTGSDEKYGGNYGYFVFPTGTKIPPLGFLVVGGHGIDTIVDTTKYKYFDITKYVGTNFCGTPRWYLNNVNGWIGLFNETGQPVDMFYWMRLGGTFSGEPAFNNKLALGSCKCVSTSIDTLPSAYDIFNLYGVGEKAQGASVNTASNGRIYKRLSDGGAWDIARPHADATPNACNDGTCKQPLSATLTKVDVNCNILGSATAIGADGMSGYTYSWNTIPSQATATATNLYGGTYSVTVTDNCGCIHVDSVTITESNLLEMTAAVATNSTCGQADGSATASITNGTPIYLYSWSTSPSQSTATATGLIAGSYIVLVSDQNNCTSTDTVTITTYSITANPNQVNAICYGDSNGVATIMSVSSGTTPYTYSWLPLGSTAQTVTGLSAGVYTVYVNDNKNCKDTVTITITQPAPILFSVDSVSSPSCNNYSDGYISVTGTGGLGGLSYSWSPALGTTNLLNGLPEGTYIITITDLVNNCPIDTSFTLTEPGVPDSANTSVSYCVSEETLTLFVLSGYTSYQWYDPSGTVIAGANKDSLVVTSPVIGSFYTVVINPGSSKCPFVDSVQVTEEFRDDTDPLALAPNVFTPNGDGYNDLFDLTIYNLDGLELEVYNRWGTKVYSGAGATAMWDGKIEDKQANEGVYYWIAKYKNICVKDGQQFIYKGFVQVMD